MRKKYIFKSDDSSIDCVSSNINDASLILPMMSRFGSAAGTITVPFVCAHPVAGIGLFPEPIIKHISEQTPEKSKDRQLDVDDDDDAVVIGVVVVEFAAAWRIRWQRIGCVTCTISPLSLGAVDRVRCPNNNSAGV